jgi:acyl-coenzyme A synthetase/AMP-(fatty) acid ligase
MAIRLLIDAETVQSHETKAGEIRRALDRKWKEKPSGDKSPLMVGLRGDDPNLMAIMADGLLNDGHRMALFPKGRFDLAKSQVGIALDAVVDLDTEQVEWRREMPEEGMASSLPPYDVVYYTSGSTGQPKGIGVTLESLRLTTDWYRLIYRLDKESVILTCMPFSYNFPFVAAFCQSRFSGTVLAFADPQRLLDLTRQQVNQGRRTVLLANPIVLEHFLGRGEGRCPGLLIDSGGAPLSQHAVEQIREKVGDLREGYGLSETCSLTHFDLVGDASSLGTVGQPMPGVETQIRADHNGRPALWIQSPNACQWIEATGVQAVKAGSMMPTGDLGAIDKQGNLRLLARSDDHQINGFWPRDTLNAIGPALGTRCALVQHKAEHPKVRISLRTAFDPAHQEEVVKRASEFLDLPPADIGLVSNGEPLLHSIKLPRG